MVLLPSGANSWFAEWATPNLTLGFWLFYSDFHTTHDAFYGFAQPGHLKIRVRFIRQLMKKYWSDPFPAPALPE